MNSTAELLEAVKRRHGIASDYALAKILGVSRQTISAYRSGTTLGDQIAMKVADELGVDRAAVLAAMAAERTRDAAVRSAWAAAVKKLGGVAAAVAMMLGGGPTPPPASASGIEHNTCPEYTMNNRRRRRPSILGVALRWLTSALVPIAFAGCTAIGHQPAPADWPLLKHVEVRAKPVELIEACYAGVPAWQRVLGTVSLACAWINFENMTCTTFNEVDDHGPVYEHELEHCAGRDHYGDSSLADYWERHKRAMMAGGATYYYTRADGQVVRAYLKEKSGPVTIFDLERPQPPEHIPTIFDH
ncbi:MAG TPA: helix-turn-helix domain-containing protein [Usitatibacter sp.]|nr:helix-turn-helix domain-containing protein [Usitatibacter sp.]